MLIKLVEDAKRMLVLRISGVEVSNQFSKNLNAFRGATAQLVERPSSSQSGATLLTDD